MLERITFSRLIATPPAGPGRGRDFFASQRKSNPVPVRQPPCQCRRLALASHHLSDRAIREVRGTADPFEDHFGEVMIRDSGARFWSGHVVRLPKKTRLDPMSGEKG